MTKRIWKLYKEVRRLRNKVKTLEADCGKANHDKMIAFQEVGMWRQYVSEHKVQPPYDTYQIIVPNMYGFETMMPPTDIDRHPRAEFLMKRMTGTAKIHIIDELMNRGYFRKVCDNEFAEVYEIKVIR